jgi:hypothetical protein
VNYIWHEGLVRKLLIERDEKPVVHLPLNVVVIGAAVAPWLAAGGLVLAVVSGCRISVVREEDASEPADLSAPPPAPGFPSPEPPAAGGLPGSPS